MNNELDAKSTTPNERSFSGIVKDDVCRVASILAAVYKCGRYGVVGHEKRASNEQHASCVVDEKQDDYECTYFRNGNQDYPIA